MPLLVQSKEQFACTDNWNWVYAETGCINRGFCNGKGLGKFPAKQFGCNKRLVALTEDVLSGFHCTNHRVESRTLSTSNQYSA